MKTKHEELLILLSELLSDPDKEKEIEALQREIKELENCRKEDI